MNPKRWRWYTWTTIVLLLVNALVRIQDAPGSWIIIALAGPPTWFFLWLLHEIVRAFYLEWTHKMPPPITRPQV